MLKNIIACFALSHIPTQGLEKLGLNAMSVVGRRIPSVPVVRTLTSYEALGIR